MPARQVIPGPDVPRRPVQAAVRPLRSLLAASTLPASRPSFTFGRHTNAPLVGSHRRLESKTMRPLWSGLAIHFPSSPVG